jgi:hypothetical protein
MAKRMTKSQGQGLGLLVVLGLLVAGAKAVYDNFGFLIPIIFVILVIAGMVWLAVNQRKKRIEYLRQKYGNEEIVQLILQHRFWQGQTSEQLIDSLGKPVTVDTKIFKTKTRETWKYNRRGANRYGLRITLDEGIVVAWEQKSS